MRLENKVAIVTGEQAGLEQVRLNYLQKKEQRWSLPILLIMDKRCQKS